MGSMSDALFAAGLTTEKQHAARQKEEDSVRRKEAKRQLGKSAAGVDDFCSLREFLKYAQKLLASEYSSELMQQVIREAHQVADRLRLPDKKRKRMHAFLAKVETALRGMSAEERAELVERQFRQADPRLVNDND